MFVTVLCGSNMDALEIVNRGDWSARPPKSVTKIDKIVPFVIVHHSYQPKACSTSAECTSAMRSMQDFHQNVRLWEDIGYK